MRPLLVIVLVAAAVAALIYALMSFTEGEEDGGSLLDPFGIPDEVNAEVREDTQLVDGMAEPLVEVEPDRVAVIEPEAQLTTDGYIAGLVVDPEDRPVVGALIQLRKVQGSGQLQAMQALLSNAPAPRPLRQAQTDQDGRFKFARVPAGRDWGLVILHDEFSRKEVNQIHVGKTGGATERVVLDRGRSIYGLVTDADSGAPIEGALVALDNPAAAMMPQVRKSADRLETFTDANGAYRLSNIPPQGRALVVMKEGYATQIDQRRLGAFDQQQQEQHVNVQMKTGLLIAGRVLDPDGAGVVGVRIEAIGSGNPCSRGETRSTRGGEFVIMDLAQGRYTLRIVAQGFDRDPLQVDAGDHNVLIELTARGGLSGVVLAPDGSSLSDFQLTVRQSHPSNIAFGHPHGKKRVKSAREGRFTFEGLKPGSYVVQADAHGYASSFSDAVVVEEGTTSSGVVVTMTSGGSIIGTIVDSSTGEPIPGVKVSTHNSNWIDSEFTFFINSMSSTAVTQTNVLSDKSGRFEIELMTPEAYQLRFHHDGFTTEVVNDISITADSVTDLGTIALSRGGTIRGVVYLESGEPAANVRVNLRPVSDDMMFSSTSGRTDAEGRYVLRAVAAGDYDLSASKPPGPGESPFMTVVHMEKSRVEIRVGEGAELIQNLYLGGN